MTKRLPVDWGYELDQPWPPEGSELWKELEQAAKSFCFCAVGEANHDYGIEVEPLELDTELWLLGINFSKELFLRNRTKCKLIRTKIRKRFDELYGRI